jgi:hypothetical protein
MQTLQFPKFEYKLKIENEQSFIFDEVRKKWLILTPEEWVRQHLVHYLIQFKHFPRGLIQIEKQIDLNGTKKRFDVLVYNTLLQTLLLVECKAPHVVLSQIVLDQVLRYNLQVKAQYILITNGLKHGVYQFLPATQSYEVLQELPDYKNMNQLS